MRTGTEVQKEPQEMFFPAAHPVLPGARGWKNIGGNQLDKSSDYQHLSQQLDLFTYLNTITTRPNDYPPRPCLEGMSET